MNAELFTASQIGAAIGKSRFAVLRMLDKIPPSGVVLVRNNRTAAWACEALPARIRETVRAIQTQRRYRTEADVLRAPPTRWETELPLAEIDPRQIAHAQKVQRALAVVMQLPEGTSTSEQARHAAESYRGEFGHSVDERTLRAIIDEAKRRDRGAREFDRLDLYLPKKLRAARSAAAEPKASAEFPELQAAFALVVDRAEPTASERSYCWRQITLAYAERRESCECERALRRALRDHVWRAAPFLATTFEAMRRQLDREIATYTTHGLAGMGDGRLARGARGRKSLDGWTADLDLLLKWCVRRKGERSLPYRELHGDRHPLGWRFSQAFRERFPFDPRRAKSKIPTIIDDWLRPQLKAIEDRILGPKQARDRMPSVRRDWSDTAAGDIHTADDLTPDHVWFEWCADGEYEFDGQRFNVGRGQTILFCDERTDFPLGFDLSLNKQPNSRMVFGGLSRIWRDEAIGLPGIGANFERNIFEAVKVKQLFSWPEIDESFARHGIKLRLRNHTTAKGKVIERVIGCLHRFMNDLPSYVGRDEQHIRYERIQKFLLSLKRVGQPRKEEVDPREMLMEKEQFASATVRALEAFADEPQNGSRLSGLSPSEAWIQLLPRTPRKVLPDSLAYLICTERSTQTVTHEGVAVKRTGGGRIWYSGSERLGALRGEKVEVYFNAELPEHVIVIHRRSDPAGVRPFSVAMDHRLGANTATAEDFAISKGQQRAFALPAVSTWRTIRPPAALTIRNELLGSPELRERGQRINELQREQIDLGQARTANRGEITELAEKLNLGIDPNRLKDPARAKEKLRTLNELIEEAERDGL